MHVFEPWPVSGLYYKVMQRCQVSRFQVSLQERYGQSQTKGETLGTDPFHNNLFPSSPFSLFRFSIKLSIWAQWSVAFWSSWLSGEEGRSAFELEEKKPSGQRCSPCPAMEPGRALSNLWLVFAGGGSWAMMTYVAHLELLHFLGEVI